MALHDPMLPSSPYYLHPNENPALVLVSPVLSSSNYHFWSRAMTMAFYPRTSSSLLTAPSRFHHEQILFILPGNDVTLWCFLVCSCSPSCSCGVFVTLQKYHDNDNVIRFLKGLHDRFAVVRSQIMLIDPLPPINKVFSLVIQQERHLPAGSSQLFVSNTLRDHTSSKKSQAKSFTDSRQCTFCGKSRHNVDTCYEKHGYPLGYKSRGRAFRAHTALNDCISQPLDSSQHVDILPSDPSVTLTQDQLQQLLTLLPASTSPPHVTNTTSSLQPNPSPSSAKVLHGLYILDSPAQTFSISTPITLSANTTSCSLWHHRLGHLSDSRLKLLFPYIPSLSMSNNATYKACHLAKQKKISFPVSTSVSNKIFELVHVDI
ncbi:uncharacterized protein LOC105764346 [Gossypium raimondii]|uniref:uncharacterized protein LOC105764346 n=1 Tax=Gossypium raimondii TaxID=29730 RepID=UPI00227D6DA1|nr:uncharacterized protein LOC105764346 [Gossypium raimondii]